MPSRGQFKPSSVASYERRERQISLDRLFSLAHVYGVCPERIVVEIAQRLQEAEDGDDRSEEIAAPPSEARSEEHVAATTGTDGRRGTTGMTFGREIGRILRRARESRGLTLRQASIVSGGRFAPTSLASYERGERAISVERFCQLAEVYGMPAERLLAEVTRAVEERPAAIIDLTALERLEKPEARLVGRFVREVVRLRGDVPRHVISLRNGDLQVLASASGRRADELLDAIRPALTDTNR